MRVPSPTVSLLAATLLGSPAAGQGRWLLQFGGATSLPGADAVGDAALYGVAGGVVEWTGDRLAATASVHGGLSADDATGADFVSAAGTLELFTGPGTGVGVMGRGGAFRIRDPFTYRTGSLRGGPAARFVAGRVAATLRAEAGTGSTLVEVRPSPDRVRRAERDLWSRGLDLDVAVRGDRWIAGGTVGTWESAGGPFRRVEGSATWAARRWAVRMDAGAWDTPLGTEWTGGVALVVPVGGAVTVAATAGRATPDPLTLVEAGDQAGVVVGWTLATFGGPPPPPSRVEWVDDGAVARFRLDDSRARSADQVEVMGDFTGWSPTPMRRDGGAWTADLPVAPGVYHYGFRVDGEWYVPEGLSGNVPDEWGRMNATLVVADEDEGGLP